MTAEDILKHKKEVDVHWKDILKKFLETGMRVLVCTEFNYHFGYLIREDGMCCYFQLGDYEYGFRCMINGRNCEGGYGYISDWDKPYAIEDIGDKLYSSMLWEPQSSHRIGLSHIKEVRLNEGVVEVL